jgi:hypothetical protein
MLSVLRHFRTIYFFLPIDCQKFLIYPQFSFAYNAQYFVRKIIHTNGLFSIIIVDTSAYFDVFVIITVFVKNSVRKLFTHITMKRKTN